MWLCAVRQRFDHQGLAALPLGAGPRGRTVSSGGSVDLAPMADGEYPDDEPTALHGVDGAVVTYSETPSCLVALERLDVERREVSRVQRLLEVCQAAEDASGFRQGHLEKVTLCVDRESCDVAHGSVGRPEECGHLFEDTDPSVPSASASSASRLSHSSSYRSAASRRRRYSSMSTRTASLLPRRVMIVGVSSRRARSMTSARCLRTSAMDSVTGSLIHANVADVTDVHLFHLY